MFPQNLALLGIYFAQIVLPRLLRALQTRTGVPAPQPPPRPTGSPRGWGKSLCSVAPQSLSAGVRVHLAFITQPKGRNLL